MSATASGYLTPRIREEQQGLSSTGPGGALEKAHGPTAKLVEHLRQARLSLERAASPELQLSCAIRALSRTEARLDRPLRVAILGEVNSGKSSLANLLAGVDSLPTAIISNTRIPTLLYYAADPEICIEYESGRRERLSGDFSLPRRPVFRIDVGLPSRRLQSVQLLDLPGFTDPISGSVVVDAAAHNVDAAIWCTMSTQAWKETERSAWEMLPPRIGSRGLLVATHGDLLHNPNDRQKMLARLRNEAGASFKSILLLSTAEALDVMAGERKGASGAAAWAASGAESLERALGALLHDLREQRAAAAARMTGRIAQRALVRIDTGLGAAGG
jgi:energy-coupling factor transporter ATP-binding protein EcfA2